MLNQKPLFSLSYHIKSSDPLDPLDPLDPQDLQDPQDPQGQVPPGIRISCGRDPVAGLPPVQPDEILAADEATTVPREKRHRWRDFPGVFQHNYGKLPIYSWIYHHIKNI